ncbi:hypothetical protein H2248_004097 [Termitomyces sp. 'cryptogamus']|nr:hypothetical protein H2248_004097 [Termitomyces sp. 'cryptogamus']
MKEALEPPLRIEFFFYLDSGALRPSGARTTPYVYVYVHTPPTHFSISSHKCRHRRACVYAYARTHASFRLPNHPNQQINNQKPQQNPTSPPPPQTKLRLNRESPVCGSPVQVSPPTLSALGFGDSITVLATRSRFWRLITSARYKIHTPWLAACLPVNESYMTTRASFCSQPCMHACVHPPPPPKSKSTFKSTSTSKSKFKSKKNKGKEKEKRKRKEETKKGTPKSVYGLGSTHPRTIRDSQRERHRM